MNVFIINLSPWPVGGFTSVTAHAYHCLTSAGHRVVVGRLNLDKTEKTERKMAYGVPYRNYSVADGLALVKQRLTLVTGVAREKDMRDPQTIYKLIDAGARVVVHGYTEHKQFTHLEYLGRSGMGVCVRQSMRSVYPGIDKFIPHPYVRRFTQRALWSSRKRAGCLAMVVPHKNPEMILLANRLLKGVHCIEFLGAEDRMYTRYKLSEKYPEYVSRNPFSRHTHPADVCRGYQMMVDLTVFGAGNGGTQYSFMEAMDAGAVCILHCDWLKDVGDMEEGANCLAVATPAELALAVSQPPSMEMYQHLCKGSQQLLTQHGPVPFSQAVEGLL